MSNAQIARAHGLTVAAGAQLILSATNLQAATPWDKSIGPEPTTFVVLGIGVILQLLSAKYLGPPSKPSKKS